MSSRPSPTLLGLYRWTLRLAPAAHRRRFAEEQVRLFEQVWLDERPRAGGARFVWLVSLLARSAHASVGVRMDRWRRSAATGGRPARGGTRMGSDVRFTLRSLLRSGWYAGTVIGVMAISTALAATTLAIVDGVLFRPLPFPDAHRLVRIQPDFMGIGRPAPTLTGLTQVFGVSAIDLQHWRAAAPDVPMTGFRAARWVGLGTGVNDDTAGMAEIESNFFDVVGVRPLLGGFSPEDFSQEAPVRPVLITYQAWQARFGGRSDVINTVVLMDRASRYGVRVVGVMPPGFVFPSVSAEVSFIAPLVLRPSVANNPSNRTFRSVIARLPPAVTSEALRDRLLPALAAVAERFPQGPKPDAWSDAGWRREGPYDTVHITTLDESLGEYAGPLFRAAVLAVVVLVLIAAANVSSLMTARALERERELATRRSLGAGVVALARLWAIEAGILLMVGAGLGLAATPVVLGLIVPLLPENVVLLKVPMVDWRVGAMVAAGLGLLAACISVAPIRRSLTAPALGTLGSVGRRLGVDRYVVVGGQVALAFALTVLGTALVGSVLAVYAEDQPLETDGMVALTVMGSSADDVAARSARVEFLRQRFLEMPGVSAATASGAQVLVGGGGQSWFVAPAGTRHPRNIDTWPVTEGFTEALAPQLVAGRLPTPGELHGGAPIVVVSERAAEAYWPGRAAVGQTLVQYPTNDVFTVIGIVRDIRWASWDVESPIVYAPFVRFSRSRTVTFFLRTGRPEGQVIADALATIEQADPLVRVRRAASLDEYFRESIALRRFQSWLFGGFAAAALLVVGAGLLGLIAMSAARRTKEVGIRCALGATPSAVTTLMVREQLGAVAFGLAAGGLLAAWAVGLVEGYLYQLTTTDPRIWGTAVVLIIAMAVVGALIPAIRASRVDPLQALRTE